MSVNMSKSIKICLATKEKNNKWFAEQLGTSGQYASRLANGPNAWSRVEQLAGIFNMRVSEFIALGESEA